MLLYCPNTNIITIAVHELLVITYNYHGSLIHHKDLKTFRSLGEYLLSFLLLECESNFVLWQFYVPF